MRPLSSLLAPVRLANPLWAHVALVAATLAAGVAVWAGFVGMCIGPPDTGVGAAQPQSRQTLAWAGLACAIAVTLGAVALSRTGRSSVSGTVVVTMVFAVIGCAGTLWWPIDELRVGPNGFTDAEVWQWGDDRLLIRNVTGRPLTVCAGRDGRCDGPSRVPERLRGRGSVLPPDGFVIVRFGSHHDYDARLTANAGVGARDTTVHVRPDVGG
jgi:hypothetical protein